MFIYYNPNPLGLNVGDCVVRMLTIVLNKSWDDAFDILAEESKKHANMPSANIVWFDILKDLGYKQNYLEYEMTVEEFCNRFNEGLFIIGTGTHVLTVVDGNFYDSWNSKNEKIIFFFS